MERVRRVCVAEEAADSADNQAVFYLARAAGLCELNAHKLLNFCLLTNLTGK